MNIIFILKIGKQKEETLYTTNGKNKVLGHNLLPNGIHWGVGRSGLPQELPYISHLYKHITKYRK